MLSFTQYTQSVLLGKCSTSVSNRFTILPFNILRCSNRRLPSELGTTDVDSYIFCLAYVVRLLSLIKLGFPKVVNSCIPTIDTCDLINIGPILGISFEFIVGTEDVISVNSISSWIRI